MSNILGVLHRRKGNHFSTQSINPVSENVYWFPIKSSFAKANFPIALSYFYLALHARSEAGGTREQKLASISQRHQVIERIIHKANITLLVGIHKSFLIWCLSVTGLLKMKKEREFPATIDMLNKPPGHLMTVKQKPGKWVSLWVTRKQAAVMGKWENQQWYLEKLSSWAPQRPFLEG